MPIHYIILADV